MSVIFHEGAPLVTNKGVWTEPNATPTPSAEIRGNVYIQDEFYYQNFELGALPEGWVWRIGPFSGPWPAISTSGLTAVRLQNVAHEQEPALVFISEIESGNTSKPLPLIQLIYSDDPIIPAPIKLDNPQNVQQNVGATISLPMAGFVEGTVSTWTLFVDGASPPPGWAVNGSGVVTIPSTTPFLSRAVRVNAANISGSVDLTFNARVDADAPRLVTPLPDFTVQVGSTKTVDFAGAVSGYQLTYTSSAGWTHQNGVFVVPTGSVTPFTAVTLTATDYLGRTVSDTFNYTITSAPGPTGPTVISQPAAVTATVGQGAVVQVVGSNFITGGTAPIVWSTNKAWTLNTVTGALTIPTDAVLATTTATLTATDANALTAVLSFSVTVNAATIPVMTVTTNPTFTGNNTNVGTTWTIAGGVYAGGVGTITETRAFFRDGTQISDYGTGTTYVLTTNDQGKTITAKVRRVDQRTPTAQTLDVDATGSAQVPPAEVVADYTVSTVAALTNACQAAKLLTGRKVIYITPGAVLGDWTLANCRKTDVVKSTVGGSPNFTLTNNMDESKHILITTDARNPARFTKGTIGDAFVQLTNVSGITFENILFEHTAKDNSNDENTPIDGVLGAPGVFPMHGSLIGNMNNCFGIVFRDVTTRWGTRNWVGQKVTDILWDRCDFLACGMDDISLFNNEKLNCRVRRCRFLSQNQINGRRATEGPRHPDAFSLQDGGTAGPTRALWDTMEDSIVVAENFYKQGAFWPNASTANGGVTQDNGHHYGLTLKGCWIVSTHAHGCYLGSSKNVLVENNYFAPWPLRPDETQWQGGGDGPPSVKFSQIVAGIVRNNALCRAFLYDNGATAASIATTVTFTNNPITEDGSGRPAALPNPPAAGPFSNLVTGRPKMIAQYVLENIGTTGGAGRRAAISPLAIAGDRVYRFVSQPVRAANAGGVTEITWAAGFTQIGDQLAAQAQPGSGADITDYICGWAWRPLTQADILGRLLPNQVIGFHGMCTDTYVRGATGHALKDVSRIAAGTSLPLLGSAQTAGAGLLLNGVASSDYPNAARKVRYGALSTIAGDAPWEIGQPAITRNQTGDGRWHGHIVNWYDHLGGTIVNKTLTPVPALGRNESITSWVLAISGNDPEITGHTITSAPVAPNTVDKTHPTIYTSVPVGNTNPTRVWLRNGVVQPNETAATFASKNQQYGRLWCDATGGGITLRAESYIDRLQPTRHGQIVIKAAVDGDVTIPLTPTTVAGDRMVLVVVNPGDEAITMSASFVQQDNQIPRLDTGDGNFTTAVGLSAVLTAADITRGSAQFAQPMKAGGFIVMTPYSNLDSIVFDADEINWAANANTVAMRLPATIETCEMLVPVIGSNYGRVKLVSTTPAAAVGTSEYIRGELNAATTGMGMNVMTRMVGGGSPAGRTITTGGGANLTMLTFTIRVLGPA